MADTWTDLPGELVFDAVYSPACGQAFVEYCREYSDSLIRPEEWTHRVRTAFGALHEHLNQHPDASLHDTLRHQWLRANSRWSRCFSAETCLSCLGRRPSMLLRCGHRVCRLCIRTFGQPVIEGQDRYRFPHCLLCGMTTEVTFITLRPRCRRILVMDGGGVRGVMSLQFLTLLEAHMGVPGLVQQLFDYVIGTSAGRSSDFQCRGCCRRDSGREC